MYEKSIFNVKARKQIYSFIKNNPGVHFRKISRSLEMPTSTLSYHLNYLMKRELLTKETENGYLRYYISQKISKSEKKIFKILRENVPRNLILYLFLYFDGSQQEIIDFAKKWKNHPSKIGYHLNKHRTTIGFHIKKLLDAGIIECFHDNNDKQIKKYRLKNSEDILDILIKYDKTLLAEAYGRFFRYIDDTNGKKRINNAINVFYDILPLPFIS